MVHLAAHVSNSGKQHLTKTKNMLFYNDTVLKLCGWHKLIHEKTGRTIYDGYYWNQIPDSKQLEEKVYVIKLNHLWDEVRSTYLEKKNMHLQRNDNTHPSFIIYIESVNQVYYKHFKFALETTTYQNDVVLRENPI